MQFDPAELFLTKDEKDAQTGSNCPTNGIDHQSLKRKDLFELPPCESHGIQDFHVQCDEENNTPAVIDRNEMVASIFIKPARSINFITLNFVATRTGADFEEIIQSGIQF